MYRISSIIFALALFLTTACDKVEVTPPIDISPNLENIGLNVIVKTYESLKDEAAELKVAVENLEDNPTSSNLQLAREAWVATRSPWEQSEGFLFGPVDQEGLDPALDSWPVNVTDLNNVLASENELTPAFLSGQEGTLKGFHTIEYLLWGTSGEKEVGEFTDREFEYLTACATVLASDAAKLSDLWDSDEGNYIKNLVNAGEAGSIYISQKSALEEVVGSLVVIADEVANGKINDPLAQQDLTLEESRFSANSKADFSDNIRSIQNIYQGMFQSYGNSNGISDLIREQDEDLDDKVKAQMADAITAIENLPGTFSDAVINNSSKVSEAQTKVRDLQETLESKVLPLIKSL